MFEREMMISGLQRQRDLLAELIREIEDKQILNSLDLDFCHDKTQRVARNLRKLRRIREDYFLHKELISCS